MMKELRYFLKDSIRKTVDFSATRQSLGYPPPPAEKPAPGDTAVIPLPRPGELKGICGITVEEAISRRRSVRQYSSLPVSLEELAFLLWATQGFRTTPGPGGGFRTVPSAGCRHPFETYLAVFRVEGLERGLYRYLPVEHGLIFLGCPERLEARTAQAAMEQPFAGKAAVTFIWTAVPSRTEWRYGEASVKVIALDAGHVCQNLYLACQAVGAGTCAIAAYDQEAADGLIGADGEEEFVIYMAPVGKTGSFTSS